jgi:DNA-directed RNA polymerase specialized sigma24 family protein
VALSAFDSFCRGVEESRFPRLHDRTNLWPLLVTITARKAYQLIRDEGRQKRGDNAVVTERDLKGPAGSDSGLVSLDHVIGNEPTPDFAAEVADEYRRLLARLPNSRLREVAQCKLEGCTNKEIAQRLGCHVHTVEVRLRVIRSLWDPV